MDNLEKPQPEVVQEPVERGEHIDSSTNSMLWLSSLSGFLSWASLVVAVAIIGLQVYGTLLQQPIGFNLGSLYAVLNWLNLLFTGLLAFVIFQVIARIIPAFIDMQDNITSILEDRE